MTDSVISYHPDAALRLLRPGRLAGLQHALEAARDATLNDVELWQSGESVPPERQPLDAGFIQWPEELLADLQANRGESLIARLETTGSRLRQLADSLVVLGIGGSYMGMRAMFERCGRPAGTNCPAVNATVLRDCISTVGMWIPIASTNCCRCWNGELLPARMQPPGGPPSSVSASPVVLWSRLWLFEPSGILSNDGFPEWIVI